MYDPKTTGTVEGTGAEIIVELGYKPTFVKLINIDDAGGDIITLYHVAGMPAASGLKNIDADPHLKITVGGITLFDGDTTTTPPKKAGFKIGTDADMNVNGETLMYMVAR